MNNEVYIINNSYQFTHYIILIHLSNCWHKIVYYDVNLFIIWSKSIYDILSSYFSYVRSI